MKTIATCLMAWLCWLSASAQVKLELVSQFLPDSVEFKDIWGYVAPDGTEYALVTSYDGFYIVSLADPAQPFLVKAIGQGRDWTDVKTWADRAYVPSNDGYGLMIVDLTGLPDDVDHHLSQVITRAHNLWIDEFGFAYPAISNIQGIPILDLAANPDEPSIVGNVSTYAHDVYARNNLLYTASPNSQDFKIFDVSDKSNPVLLASHPVPGGYSHSIWLSDDGNTVFVADEITYSPVTSFDVSDFDEIEKLDEWRMPIRPGLGSVPHNVFYKNGYLLITHYVDGLVLVDAHEPDNLVTVGQYDTDSIECAGELATKK